MCLAGSCSIGVECASWVSRNQGKLRVVVPVRRLVLKEYAHLTCADLYI